MRTMMLSTLERSLPSVCCSSRKKQWRCQGLQSRRKSRTAKLTRRNWQNMKISANKETYTEVETVPAAPVTEVARSATMNWSMPLAALVLGALLYNPLRKRFRPAVTESLEADDDLAYRRAVARTRQSIHVHRAIGFMNTNAPARVMVELDRALTENSVCRSELVLAQYSPGELRGLYEVHLRNAEVPPDYATLLQLREMLGISQDAAVRIEKDISKTDSFVI